MKKNPATKIRTQLAGDLRTLKRAVTRLLNGWAVSVGIYTRVGRVLPDSDPDALRDAWAALQNIETSAVQARHNLEQQVVAVYGLQVFDYMTKLSDERPAGPDLTDWVLPS